MREWDEGERKGAEPDGCMSGIRERELAGLDGCGNGMREREGGEAAWMENWVKGERRERGWMEAKVG